MEGDSSSPKHDFNDVVAMAGINLPEESQGLLTPEEFVETSAGENSFLSMVPLRSKILEILSKQGLVEPGPEVIALISQAAQGRLEHMLQRLSSITAHRLATITDPKYAVSNDVKGQLKFLADLDRAEHRRHEAAERDMVFAAAREGATFEERSQAKIRKKEYEAKEKEMRRVEVEELHQRQTNEAVLQAIGVRKTPKVNKAFNPLQPGTSGPRDPLRKLKVTLRDLQFLCETDKDLCKSTLLYKSYLM